jgi:uncharacterized protein with ParB-like and HNH nuclease domain
MSIGTLMREVENNDYYLPAIQREFVWKTHKIEALFDSLLRGYPIGIMLRWKVEGDSRHDFQFYKLIDQFDVRNSHNQKTGKIAKEAFYGVLDGQQRHRPEHRPTGFTYREALQGSSERSKLIQAQASLHESAL